MVACDKIPENVQPVSADTGCKVHLLEIWMPRKSQKAAFCADSYRHWNQQLVAGHAASVPRTAVLILIVLVIDNTQDPPKVPPTVINTTHWMSMWCSAASTLTSALVSWPVGTQMVLLKCPTKIRNSDQMWGRGGSFTSRLTRPPFL